MDYAVVSRKCKISSKDIEAIYDIDDICWDLVGRICAKLGIEYSSWTSFYVSQNKTFSPELIREANALLASDSIYHDMKFYDGIEDILRPKHEFGIKVGLNSHSLSKTMNDLKREQLKAAVPGLRDEDMTFTIIKLNQPTTKRVTRNAIVFADDNPYNIVNSEAQFNVMRSCPWNTSQEGLDVLGGRPVTRLDNLRQINDFVYTKTSSLLKANNNSLLI